MLGLGSAILLAGANVFVKAGGDILASRVALQMSAALLSIPLAFLVPPPDTRTWGALALAVPAHALYQGALIRALTRADLSLVFPVMRGAAPLLTALVALATLQETLRPLALLGLTVSALAAIAFALPERLAPGDPVRQRAALGWALATGAAVALYNVVDAAGVRAAPSQFTFIVWLFLLDWVCITLLAVCVRGRSLVPALRAKLRFGLAGGAFSVGSYGMALYGFSIAPVAQVSALRETAVVFAALMAALWLKEPFGLRRGLLALLMAGGLGLLRLA